MGRLYRLQVTFASRTLLRLKNQSIFMHELSIAQNIVEVALEHLIEAPGSIVRSIRLKIGALSCVHRDSLMFSFELITAETPLQGAELIIDSVPVVVFCPTCQALRELPGIQRFVCPVCQTRTGDIRQGKELDIESIEVEPVGLAVDDAKMKQTNPLNPVPEI
jgi:hydrogenase nickel incorporation protein HypA/HybF